MQVTLEGCGNFDSQLKEECEVSLREEFTAENR